MAALHGMTNRPTPVATQPRPPFQSMIVPAAADGGLLGFARQQLEEGFELFRIEPEVRRELTEDRAELCAEPQHARAEQVAAWRFGVVELQYVREIARPLDREDEVCRRGIRP